MNKIHLILQGKGGVGKSMIAAIIAQYRLETNPNIICVDTDPVNNSFKGYTSLNVQSLNILKNGNIEPRLFDVLINMFAEHKDEGCDFLIDSGASSFVALSNYIKKNDIATIVKEIGYELVLHTVITSGQAFNDTILGFAALVQQFPINALFVVWINPQFGEVLTPDNKNFTQTKIYQENAHKINNLINLPDLDDGTFKADFASMLQRRETFNQALANPAITFMERHRLKKIKHEIWDVLDNISIIQ